MQSSAKSPGNLVILVCIWLMGFALETPLLCVPPVLHIIAEELHLSYAQSGFIFSVPLIILAAIAIPGGALADEIGIRKAAGIGIIVIIAGNLLRGTSTNFLTLLVYTCIYGIGFGLVYPNLPKLVGARFPPEKIGLATGVYSSGIIFGIALALAITLPVVFPITNTFQGVFFIWTIPAVAAAIMWWTTVKEPHTGGMQSKPAVEANRSSYSLWTNRTLWLIAVLFFLTNYIAFSWLGWAPQLMMSKGAPPALAALMASVMTWVSIPVTFAAPWASDRAGSRKLFLWPSFILLVLALVGAIYAPLAMNWAIVIAVGIAAGVQLPIILSLPPQMVPAEGVGKASGMIMSIGYIGGLIGPWLAGYILDMTGSLSLNLVLLSVMSVAGIFLALMLPETVARTRLHQK